MKIEQQVVSLELAKKLKEAGYPQDDSLWYWVDIGVEWTDYNLVQKKDVLPSVEKCPTNCYAAPTVAELGEELPAMINNYILVIKKRTTTDQRHSPSTIKTRWSVVYEHLNRGNSNMCEMYADTEADARAKMWLYLKEKGLIDG